MEAFETRNLSRAAETLLISRSAVGQNIKELERQLGVTLFTPSRKGVIPTGEACNLYPVIKSAISSIMDAEKNLQSFTSESAGIIRILIPDQEVMDYFMSNYLKEFCAKYPKVQFKLLRFKSLDVLRTGNADFVFDFDYKFKNTNFETKDLFYAHGNLIVHKALLEKHGLSQKISKEAFVSLPIITYDDDPWSKFYRQTNQNNKHLAFETDASNVSNFLVKNALGVGWSCKEILEMLNDPNIVEISVEGLTLPTSVITCAYNKNLSRPARVFLDGLIDHFGIKNPLA